MSEFNAINKKRRTSILKKRPSTEDDPTEITVSKFPKKTQFSQKKQIKEFTQCDENLTIWGNTYETSVAKSDGSSDGSSTSRKISVDFSHTTINMTTHEAASMNESEKENIIITKPISRISEEHRSSLNNISSASNSIELTTVDMNASERKRINDYGTDNLNITNMPLDNSYISNKNLLNVPSMKPQKVLSPRKMVFFHKNSNLSVIIKDKVLLSPSEMDDNVSVSIEDDEKPDYKKPTVMRKTITKPVDMNMSVDNKAPENVAGKSLFTSKPVPTIFKKPEPTSVSKIVPTVFKAPELPKTFSFQKPICYDSPPIKPAVIENQKEEIDELFEMMVSDTPSKNLCCLGKTHTPQRSAQKVLFSASRPMSLRKSTDIFKEIGLMDDDDDNNKLKPVRRTIFHDESMKIEDPQKGDNRKTILDKIKMDETIETKNKTRNDGDLDISIEPETKINSVPSKIKIFNDNMEETCTEMKTNKTTAQKSFFELDDDEPSCSVSRNIQLMKLKPADYESVEKSLKRSTLSNDTCNATNFIMELTNIDDTGGSLETTAEIQRKAAKLLKNPNATLGSSSTINSPFPEDISECVFKEPSKIHKSLNMEPDMTFENLQKSSTSFKNRMTTFDENKMEISGIEPTIEDPNELPIIRKSCLEKSQADQVNQSVKNRTTTYNVDQMDISRNMEPEHTNTASLKQYKIHMSPKEVAKLKSSQSPAPVINAEPKKRVTTYNADNMDLSECEVTATGRTQEVVRDSVIKSVKSTSRIQIYTDDNESMQEEVQNKRSTTYNNDINVSVAATNQKRETCYNLNNMDVTGVDSASDFGNRASMANMNSPVPDDITDFVPRDIRIHKSMLLEPAQLQYVVDNTYKSTTTKDRATTYKIDQMDVTNVGNTSDVPVRHGSSRMTTYNADHMDMTITGTTPEVQVKKQSNSRATTYNVDQMDVTIAGTTSEHPVITKSSSRTTTYKVDQMDVISPGNTHSEHPVNKRATTYKVDQMDMTITGTISEIPMRTKSSSRTTTYNADQMDVTSTGIMSEHPLIKQQKSLATTYNADQMDVIITGRSSTSELPVNKQQRKRPTTYNIDQMDITTSEAMSSQPVTQPSNSRTTSYNINQMDMSGTEQTSSMPENNRNIQSQVPTSTKSRATTYNIDQMNLTTSHDPTNLDHTIMSNLRTSVPYEIHVSPKEMAIINRSLEKSTEVPKKRVTTYNADDMDVTASNLQTQRTRESIYNAKSKIEVFKDDNMSMEFQEDKKHVEVTSKNRVTTYNQNDMNETVPAAENKRMTNYDIDISGIEATDDYLKRFVVKESAIDAKAADMALEEPKSIKCRTTTYNVNAMDMSAVNTSIDHPEHTKTSSLRIQKQFEVHVSPKEVAKAKRADRSNVSYSQFLDASKPRVTSYNVGQMDISGSDNNSIPKIQVNDDNMQHNMSMEIRESPLHKKRATTHNRNEMDISALMVENTRKTSYHINNMDVSSTAGSSGFCDQSPNVEMELESNDRRKTFTVNKNRESMKWHNVTDTDLLNMLDDESDLCLQDVSTSNRVSSEQSNISRYEVAMEDFMNLTIKASPLNQSVPFEVKMKQRRESRVSSTIPNYNSMFDNLVEELKHKDRPKPRLEIDEYLEMMKIEPIKIPKYPQNQDSYLHNKVKDMMQFFKEKFEERRRLKKEIEAMQFPQIPTEKFLIKNYIECMETEMLKEVELRLPVIAPVFPEAIDFEKLLNNKFRTDEHLSKYWKLDSLFWYKGRFKLTHNRMNMFTLNFMCQQYLSEADESTIPIIFRDVMLYIDPYFRKSWTTTLRNSLTRREFHRVINGVDNFTSICNSSNQLFAFLDYYHTNVMRANEMVDNFLNIVNKYKAVFKVHHMYKYEMVRKRCFFQDDKVDIEISVDGYLDEISIKDLTINGLNFRYTLAPQASTKDVKGLMLVELVLFDTEKFLQNNTCRVKIEEDL